MAVSASTKTAIENFIKGVEEGRHPTRGEVPDPHGSNSGVTIAAGFDLGTQNLHDLHQFNLPQDLIDRLTPYLGLRREEALHFLNDHPLTISQDERQLINHALTERLVQRVESRYNHDSAIPFDSLPQAAQVIIASVAHQYGDLRHRENTRPFWNDAITQNWHQAISDLRNIPDRYPSRHNREAQYLQDHLASPPDGGFPKDGRTLDQVLGPPDPPLTQKEINDLLTAAPGERSDAEVQAEKQQGMKELMKEIGADEPKQQPPETWRGLQPRSDGEGVSTPPTPDETFQDSQNPYRKDDDATDSKVFQIDSNMKNPLDALKPKQREGQLPMGPFDFSPEGNLSDPYPGPSDGRTLDQVLGPPDPSLTQKEINDLLTAAPGERSDAEVQAEKQQGMEALMKEIGADEPKQSLQSPETLQGKLADARGYGGGSSDTRGYDGGSSDAGGYDGGYSDAGGYDGGSSDGGGASEGDA